MSELNPVPKPPNHAEIKNVSDFMECMKYAFSQDDFEDFFDDLGNNLEFRDRANNPEYLKLLARTAIMAAEYGMPETAGLMFRHGAKSDNNPGGYRRDYLHPAHVLETGVYLAKINQAATEYKVKALDWWGKHGDANVDAQEHFKETLAKWVKPEKGEVKFPEPDVFFGNVGYEVHRERIERKLPSFVPDSRLHKAVKDIPLTSAEADVISKTDFEAKIMPLAKEAFGWIDMDKAVFGNDGDW